MGQYANQKTITIHREIPDFKNSKRQFITAFSDNISAASRNLNGVPFKLYIYFLTNKDNYSLDYSPQHFANIFGCSLDAAKKARVALENAGYLIEDGGKIHFYEEPQERKNKMKVTITEEKRLAEQEDGTFKPMTYSEVWAELKEYYPEETIKQIWDSLEVWS